MRIVVIGGTGHIGSYLVPRLAEKGYEVISISRRADALYNPSADRSSVQTLSLDRTTLERDNQFGQAIAKLNADIVVDLICFSIESALQLVDALSGQVKHFLHCGTIWVHGRSITVPTTEAAPRNAYGEYAEAKVAIETLLLERAENGFPATVIHPGHIVGPGWAPVNPQGHFDTSVFKALKNGEQITLPNSGMETLHHVHADDVAALFVQAIEYRSNALGEAFHAVSEGAITLRGYAEAVAKWFEQPAELRFIPISDWLDTLPTEDAANAWEHLFRSQNCSIAKAQQRLDYQPRYSSLDGIQESINHLVSRSKL